MTDPKKNIRVQNAHNEAEEQGLKIGTTRYFQFLDQKLGYAQPEAEDDDVADDNNNRTGGQVSAPPSRTATSPTGRTSATRITLTPEQREIARLSGIDEITYAKNLQKMQDYKAQGLIN